MAWSVRIQFNFLNIDRKTMMKNQVQNVKTKTADYAPRESHLLLFILFLSTFLSFTSVVQRLLARQRLSVLLGI